MADQLKIPKIDFLNIDVAGHELFALRGVKALLSSGSISFIRIEFGHAARGAGVYMHDIVKSIDEYEYGIFVIRPSGLLPLDTSPFTENRYSYTNVLLANNSVLHELSGHVLKR